MQVAAFRCPSCAATVTREDVRCSHCGTRIATVACPRCFGLVPFGEAHCGHCGAGISLEPQGPAGPCPECKEALAHTANGPLGVDQCLRCGGVWMARITFEKVTQDREIQAAMVGYLPPAEPSRPVESVRYRPCPSCSRFMNRLNYGRISGVIVDICKEDGVWFDQNELRRVLDFIQAGGLEKARGRQIRELEDAKRIQNQGLVIDRANAPNDWTQMPATQGSVVTDLVFELFKVFTR